MRTVRAAGPRVPPRRRAAFRRRAALRRRATFRRRARPETHSALGDFSAVQVTGTNVRDLSLSYYCNPSRPYRVVVAGAVRANTSHDENINRMCLRSEVMM